MQGLGGVGYATSMARPRLIRLFTEDLGTKGLALALAFALWVAVSFLGTRTLAVSGVSVGVVNLRDELAVAAPLGTVDVKIRVPRSLLRGSEPQDLVRAFVDVSGRGIGPQSAEVTVSPSDPRVDVMVVLPPRLNLTLDPVVQRSLPVAVVPEGTPADGFKVGEVTADPKTVQVRGALGRLQATQTIPVPVPVQGAQATIEGEYPPRPPEGITSVTERVRVTVEILQAEETKTLGVRVVTRGTPATGYWARSVTTEPSVVTVTGPREAMHDRAFVETVPVDVQGARSTIERVADVTLPAGVTLQGGEPRVKVTVEIVPLEGTKEVNAAVQVSEVPENMRVTSLSPGNVRVVVQGSGETFDRLRGDDVRVVISASGRSSGTFTVRPGTDMARAPDGIRVVSVEGVDVAVTLEGG